MPQSRAGGRKTTSRAHTTIAPVETPALPEGEQWPEPLEAMALGRPVLVGSGTPAAELADAGAAVAVEPQPDALASAITALGSDEAAHAALRRSARELLRTSFSPQRVAAAYERIYEELLA